MFIDESGTFNNIDDRYYVISGIVSNDVDGLNKLQKDIEIEIRNGQNTNKEMKASHISDSHKAKFVQALLANKYHVYSVIMDKNVLKEKNGIRLSEFSAYNYIFEKLVSLVLEDNLIKKSDDLCLKVDYRSVIKEFENDLASLLILDFYYQVHRIDVEYLDSKISRPIQLADYVSNTIFGYFNNENEAYTFVPLFDNIKKCLVPENLLYD
jgi:hypothetical protein